MEDGLAAGQSSPSSSVLSALSSVHRQSTREDKNGLQHLTHLNRFPVQSLIAACGLRENKHQDHLGYLCIICFRSERPDQIFVSLYFT